MKKLALTIIAVTTLALVIESQTTLTVTNQGATGVITGTNSLTNIFYDDLLYYHTNLVLKRASVTNTYETAFEFEYKESGVGNIYSFSTNALKQLIDQLCAKGEICKVKGHNWRGGRPGEDGVIFNDYHPNVSYRTCRLCGACQSQTLEWK